MRVLELTFYGNTVSAWLVALVVAVAIGLGLAVLRPMITRRLAAVAESARTVLDDAFLELVARTHRLFIFILAVYAGATVLILPVPTRALADSIIVIALLAQIALWANHLVITWLARQAEARGADDPATATKFGVLRVPAQIAVWALVALVALDNLGVDVTALVAGLGVGGIAVALATQNILGDLFASLSIVLDKPFVKGDFIAVGSDMGTVEYIGLKTTRIRALTGEQIVWSNADLLQSRVYNYQDRRERRVVFGFGTVYQTPPDKIAAIPDMVREIIEAQPATRFERGHFTGFGDSSLDFGFVYHMEVPDTATYLDVQQAINLGILRRFEADGIAFAYPTRTLFVERGEESPES